ncbi:MAG: TonB-dependent receptor [Bacteroidales bacterium]|nr:TonB-dependent receptor [Bacteroidales bacterium]
MNIYKKIKISILSSAILFSSVCLHAASGLVSSGSSKMMYGKDSLAVVDTSTVYLSEISVLASRVPIVWHKQARMVTTINSKAVQSTPSQSINDVLKYSASVDVRQRGPIGAQTDVGIRGGSSEQSAILLNGINISDPQTSHNSFDLPLTMMQIDGIDILEGPSGKITGSSSLMGAINIRTRISDENKLFANVETGSYGYLSVGLRYDLASLSALSSRNGYSRNPSGGRLGSGSGRFKNSLSASYTRSDGYSRSADNHLNMDFKAVKAFYEGLYSDSDIELSWFAGLSSKDWGSNRFYAKYDEQFEHTFKTFAAVKGHNVKGAVTISPSIYWNHTDDRFELFRNNPDAYPFNYHRTNVYGLNLNNYFKWIGGTTAFGGEIRNEDLMSGNLGEPLDKPKHIKGTDRFYDHGLNRTNTSFFLEHNFITEYFSASAAVLAIKNSWAQMDMKLYPSADFAATLYKDENRLFRLFASYNSSLRMPSVTELYYSVGGFKADKHLKPEEVKAWELGLKYNSAIISASASFFRNRMTNLIDWIRDTSEGEEAVWQSVNFGKIISKGLLLQTGLRPDFHSHVMNLKSINLSYSYIDQTKAKSGEYQSTYALEYLRHKFVASADVEVVPSLTLSVFYRFQDRVGTFTDSEGQVKGFKPYGVFDAKLSYDWLKFQFYLEGNNLTNIKYHDFGRIPQPGFWFMAGVKFSL